MSLSLLIRDRSAWNFSSHYDTWCQQRCNWAIMGDALLKAKQTVL
jgi:hypothetical protein